MGQMRACKVMCASISNILQVLLPLVLERLPHTRHTVHIYAHQLRLLLGGGVLYAHQYGV
jgi:hypothetical protein